MSTIDSLAVVARRLDTWNERMVFVVGAVRGLLITDPAAPAERPTDDVDVIVEVASTAAFHRLGRELRALGFREDTSPGAPICRWLIEGVRVGFMPTRGDVLGFRNRWYSEAIAHPIDKMVRGQSIRIVDGPHFCATKLDAFSDRGGGDFYHHDLEDVVAVVDGREELLEELRATGDHVRRYVASELRTLLGRPGFVEALPGHLAGDPGSQARLPLVRSRLEALAVLAD